MKDRVRRKKLLSILEDSIRPVRNIPKKVPAQEVLSTPQKNILIVDDEQSHLEFTSLVLNTEGFNSITAKSVDDGIAHLQSNSAISMILADLEMPVHSGFILLDFIRNNLRFKNIPVIVVSANSNLNIVKKTTNYNISYYISKPFSAEMLISKMNEVFENEWRNVLVITGTTMIGDILSNTLSRGGFKPMIATTGNMAQPLLKSEKIHAIVCDLILEDMAGLQILEDVNESCPGVPVIFFIEQNSRIKESDIISAGGHGLINIPFNNIELLNRLRSLKLNRA